LARLLNGRGLRTPLKPAAPAHRLPEKRGRGVRPGRSQR
jgi:hypothetical protein